MSQVLFTTKLADALAPTTTIIPVKVGFQPGKIELINQTAIATPVIGHVASAVWNYGMVSGSAILRTFNAGLVDIVSYTATNGFAQVGFTGVTKAAIYGPIVSAFTNASPGVITVNSTIGVTAGCVIKVEGIADDETGTTLNGIYTVAAVTGTTITTATDTRVASGYAVYVSGGFVTVITNATPTSPNPPYNIYSDVQPIYNASIQGFVIGTALLANAAASDLLLISVWDINSP